MPLSVFARPARWRIFGFLEWLAAASFLAGIFSPCGTPRSRCNCPGRLIALLIHFLAIFGLLVEFTPAVIPHEAGNLGTRTHVLRPISLPKLATEALIFTGAFAVIDVAFGSLRGINYTKLAQGLKNLLDRKSTRLNSSHQIISYAVFCLKKKKNDIHLYP